MAFVVGLTGGISSGKTTVADLFHQNFSIDIIDADVVARQVVEKGSPGLAAITTHFGQEILNDDGTLNRSRLREIIFADQREKSWLNQLLHPMIRQKMQTDLAQTSSPYTLLVIPLLVENQLQSMTDRILVVDVDEETQIQRTMTRDGISRQHAQNILSAQATRAERLAVADDVINNNAVNQKLLSQITELHQKYLAMSGRNL
ncbi:dephospho-CoA kinase [Vibrio mangrovi]|uniref:Dephospho-CoA kinase n=1 Tax=Vibrio mangrovi TaxID=474394 RepID=A0A1Y6IXL4_9VIBR|nr:dephospho-CoA kinase [Vibrio mangrovi]MDW6002991.1 dephospho-CoA kinase [Vibrio mangrovi]SMS01232.1 Dephospho-CoA kinase [Vibrio mangrovi]